jgi:Domain of unknown function (DUF4431)
VRWFAAVALWLGLTGPALAAHCTPTDTPVVVQGTIVRQMFYGPPNFGEDPRHDERGFYPVLRTDRPLKMCQVPGADFAVPKTAVRFMQMIFYRDFDRALYGRHVVVRARLFGWQTAFHHTPVMLEVIEVRNWG